MVGDAIGSFRHPAHEATPQEFLSSIRTVWTSEPHAKTRLVMHQDFGMWWISRDGHSIINDNSSALEVQISGCSEDPGADMTTSITRFTSSAEKVLQHNNFVRNVRNSSSSMADNRFYDYVQGYERQGMKAVVVVDPDCAGADGEVPHRSVVIALTERFAANEEAQRPILEDLKLGSDVIVHIGKREGDLAIFNVNYRRSGHYVVARLMQGHWRELIAGQDVPTCGTLQRLQIPAGFMDCYDPAAA